MVDVKIKINTPQNAKVGDFINIKAPIIQDIEVTQDIIDNGYTFTTQGDDGDIITVTVSFTNQWGSSDDVTKEIRLDLSSPYVDFQAPITYDTTPSIEFTTNRPNEELRIDYYDSYDNKQIIRKQTDANGKVIASPTIPLTYGDYEVIASLEDALGNKTKFFDTATVKKQLDNLPFWLDDVDINTSMILGAWDFVDNPANTLDEVGKDLIRDIPITILEIDKDTKEIFTGNDLLSTITFNKGEGLIINTPTDFKDSNRILNVVAYLPNGVKDKYDGSTISTLAMLAHYNPSNIPSIEFNYNLLANAQPNNDYLINDVNILTQHIYQYRAYYIRTDKGNNKSVYLNYIEGQNYFITGSNASKFFVYDVNNTGKLFTEDMTAFTYSELINSITLFQTSDYIDNLTIKALLVTSQTFTDTFTQDKLIELYDTYKS